MTVADKTTIKSYFEIGDRPTQAQFADLIDSAIRDATVAIADGIENDGIIGLLYIKSNVSVTAVPQGTYGTRLIAAKTTAAVAENIRTELGITVLVTGGNDTVCCVSAGNIEFARLNTRSIFVTGQVNGDVLVVANASAWTVVTTSVNNAVLMSNGTAAIPSFEPIVDSTAIATISGRTQVTVENIPYWATQITLLLNNVQCTTNSYNLCVAFMNVVDNVSAGYNGHVYDADDPGTTGFSGNFVLARLCDNTEHFFGQATFEKLDNNRCVIMSSQVFATAGGNHSIATGCVNTSTDVVGFKIFPSTGSFNSGMIGVRYRR